MEKILKYSVLRYSPSIVSGESINLGILYSDEATGFHSFRFTHRLNRVLQFDDTLSKEKLLNILEGIETTVSEQKDDFDIDKYIKYYINSYRFERTQHILYDDLEKTMEELYAMFFRFDYAKEERPSRNKDMEMMSRILKSSGKNVKKNTVVQGCFEDKVKYDFVLGDCYIKLFDYDGKSLSRSINSAKTWAWNAMHEKKKVYIIFRYNEDELSLADFKIIERIFKDANCEFCSIENSQKLFSKVE